MKFIRASILLLGFCISIGAYAIAPVVDAYDDGDDSAPSSTASSPVPKDTENAANSAANNKSSFSLGQRLSIQEQQIANLNPLLVQVDDLTQKVQVLQGKLEEQQHRIKLLEDQIRSQYQDIDKRLTSRTAPVSAGSTVNPSSSPVANATHTNLSAPAAAVKTSVNPIPGAATAVGERAYQAAFQLLKNKQYPLAIQGFEDFIKKYPADINLPNANYFLGQLYLLQGQPEQSIGRFNHFTAAYPQDARIPDALLQLGLAYFAKGEKSTAMDTFKKIIQRYPDSKAAQAAQARLQQFQAMISAANANIVAKSKV
ncbi:tol-pal system protein YbgF [Candidatus Rickettsiella viridis]|uniref:Cell division coordinator CpoB n=1 Tax=Candidatus Rickettsiella viridis TaxID=676208 RepID=A0A2Z5UW68_9COXI|nr:tol-pal system protein YbgF [Candidatus Rickettsiella viridis]BBB15281.1 tol-pal system protein YbgF [Candidatus Rickettsiella viridis]